MAEQFSPEEVARRIEAQRNARASAEAEAVARRYEHIRPFGTAAASYVQQVQNDERFYLGINAVDVKTRGHARGELAFITGRAGSGKTQLILNAIHNNSDRHVIVFTPDETPEMVLAKLVALRYGISAEVLEERVKAKDSEYLQIIQHAADRDFSKLIVIDAGLTLEKMGSALDEAEDYWQARCDLAVYDYLEMLPGGTGFSDVAGKAQGMKMWTTTANVPMLCMHQGKRGEGNTRGTAQGMDSMRYGGEAEAIVVLEVFRKRDNKALSPFEREHTHKNTVTVNVAKNKRPPMKTGEVDLYMNPETGHIRALTNVDLTRDGVPTSNAADLLQARRPSQ